MAQWLGAYLLANMAQRFCPEKMYVVTIVVALLSLLLAWVATVESGRLLPFAQESVDRDKLLVYERKG